MGFAVEKQDKQLDLIYTHKGTIEDRELVEIRKHNGISIYKDFFAVTHEKKIGDMEYEFGYADGGDVVNIKRKKHGHKNKQYGGGDRGLVWWMSKQSKKRMLRTLKMLNQAKIDESRILFISLTHDENGEERTRIDGREHKRQLKAFCRWMQQKYGGFAAWKFELQVKRFIKYGHWVGHWHLIWFEVGFVEIGELCRKWNEITKGSDLHKSIGVDVVKARDWKHTLNYTNKLIGYMAKSQTSFIDEARKYCKDIGLGRVWGTINKKRLNECIDWVQGTIDSKVYSKMIRGAKLMYRSWLRKKQNIKGIADGASVKGMGKLKTWQKMWHRQMNICVEWFMGHEDFIRLLRWAGWKGVVRSDEVENGFDELKLIS